MMMEKYPDNYEWLTEKFGSVLSAHQELGKSLQEAGPIDKKNAQLIQLVGAAANRSQGAVHSHAKRALAAGASPDEIYHAILLLTSTVGFPVVAAALSWAREVVEKR
jgi:4-carboxymuconolactone decarboxylase